MSDGFHYAEPACQQDDCFDELCTPINEPEPSWCESADQVADIVRWLPRLGCVLWVYREHLRRPSDAIGDAYRGWPGDQLTLQALVRCTAIRTDVSVTSQGPRECVEFVGRDSVVQAKLFLLPDTDYLAWDLMLASHRGPSQPADGNQWQAPLRYLCSMVVRIGARWHAVPMRFTQRRSALAASIPHALSPMGERLAITIAKDERAEWNSTGATQQPSQHAPLLSL